MTVDPAVVPGLLLLALELLALAAIGYVVARVALRQSDDLIALAQGLVIGLALWGLIVNFLLHLFPGMAGAVAGWIVVLALGTGLAWRRHHVLRISPHTLAGFSLAGTAIFWVALASRQLLIIPDGTIHTTLPATIRAGGWPPKLSWNPDLDLAYHHGVDLLIGLLTPPTGPDLAFTTELFGAYAWTSLVLAMATLLIRHSSWVSTLVLVPLLLAAGAWTLVFGDQPTLLQVPVPTGAPVAGLRAALGDVYWPEVALPWSSEQHGAPPNIWKPQFTLAYPLALVVLERVAARSGQALPAALTLAGLVGFLGLVDETVAPVVLTAWGAAEVFWILRARRTSSASSTALLRRAAGPMLAALLLAGGGGVLTGVLTEAVGAGELSAAWPMDPRDRGALSSVITLDGGLGLLGLGSLVLAVAAYLIGRNLLVLMLGAGSVAFLFAALILRYEAAPHDLGRFDGHARNFALLAFMLALSVRLAALRPRWRYAAAVAIAAFVTWPTVAEPARKLGLTIGHGVQVANAPSGPSEFGEWYWWMGRSPLERFRSERIAGWLRTRTAVDARVLSPTPYAMTTATGRLNASGFAQVPHTRPQIGPEYLDAVRHLDTGTFRRLGIDYVHAPDDWVASLPLAARQRLADPQFFHPLIRDGAHTLYRVLPAFMDLDIQPAPGSFEALRQAVPAGFSVYLSPTSVSLNMYRAMAVLPHARLLGSPDRAALHLQAELPSSPLSNQTADLVVTSAQLAPSMFHPNVRRPVFWNQEIAVYAPDGELEPTREPPTRPFKVWLADAEVVDGRIAFTATLTDTSGEGWTGQDWLVVQADASPWALPRIRPTDPAVQWFGGQASPRPGTVTHRYVFDSQSVTLARRDAGQNPTEIPSSGAQLDPGVWILGVRLRSGYDLAAFIPAIKITVTDAGNLSYHVYKGELAVQPSSSPITQRERRL